MDRLRRPWKFTRRDTDSVQLEGISPSSGAEPVQYGKDDIHAQTKSADSETNSQEVKAAEEDLRRFSVLHEFDPNLPCKHSPSIFFALPRLPRTYIPFLAQSFLLTVLRFRISLRISLRLQ